jgi:hypothetical protein
LQYAVHVFGRPDMEEPQVGRVCHEKARTPIKRQLTCRREPVPDRGVSHSVAEAALLKLGEACGWCSGLFALTLELMDQGRAVFLDVDLPEIEDFPARTASIADDGRRLVVKKKSQRALRAEYARHIHGVAFRLAGTAFAVLPEWSGR